MKGRSIKGCDIGFVKGLSVGLGANEALTSLNLADNELRAAGAKHVAEAIKVNGTLVSVNLLSNGIDAENAQNLADILKEHPTLTSLCGHKGDETELDMSSKKLGSAEAIMLAPEIAANGVLTRLNISDNKIGASGAQHVAKALESNVKNNECLEQFIRAMIKNTAITNLDFAQNGIHADVVTALCKTNKQAGTYPCHSLCEKLAVA
eukprot:g1866.t1